MADKWRGASESMRVLLAAACVIWATGGAIAVGGQQPVAGQSGDSVWQGVSEPASLASAQNRRRTDPGGPYALVRLNKTAFDQIARRAPNERTARDAVADVVLTLPMPDGRYEHFRVLESPILAPELAAAFPEFKTYRAQGLDDPTATARFGWTAVGFHAIILSAGGTVYIDPWMRGNLDDYVSFNKADVRSQGDGHVCLVGDPDPGAQSREVNTFPITNGDVKRTYRLALAATGEYTVAAGGTKALALARMTTTINRVTGIYERDLSATLTLSAGTAADPTALIYTNGSADPYTNDDASAMLTENQTNLDAVVGTANYDVGHVFSTAGGGFATVGSVCAVATKANGVTGISNPTGDRFDVDYVAHELGHQFGGRHTFNGTSSNCTGSNRSPLHAFEVGSGSTIMAYAGICSPENLQPNSNDQFHVESLNEITAFLTSGGGASCGTTALTGNALPTVVGGATYTIPRQTPFTLTAAGSDANGDSITYQWDEFDLGTASSSVAEASTDDGLRPLFRSYPQSSNPTRTFPSLTYILNSANVPPPTYSCPPGTCLTGETLPATNRTMNFQVTARDNRSGGGAVATSWTQVTVTTAAGPFAVTSPNSNVSWVGGTHTVTWNAAGTAVSPVSTANVKISLSTDGGTTFSTVLASSAPNSGSAQVTIPDTTTTTARIKVEAIGNIFFDISDTNFTITGPIVSASPSSLRFGAVKAGAGSPITAQTPAQTVTITFSGASGSWTAATTQAWLSIAGGSGSGAGTFAVALQNPGDVIGGNWSLSGTITITSSTASNSPLSIPVTLTVDQTGGILSKPPIGLVDSPAQNATGQVGAIGVTGWVVDDVGIKSVTLYRNCLAFEPALNCALVNGVNLVYIGDATIVTGARPDIEIAYPSYPQNNRAAWGYLLLTNMLPHVPNSLMFGGQGTLTLYVLAEDREGHQRWLGRDFITAPTETNQTPTTFTMANDTIAKPFGAIDTPKQGETVSGSFWNFGWTLTPDSNTTAEAGDILMPLTGATQWVYIDGVAVAPLGAYNLCRGTVSSPPPDGVYCDDDVSNIFGNPTPQPTFALRTSNPTKHRNLDAGRGPIAAYYLDTTTLGNGIHTIVWGVTDSAGRGEGIGSRYFTVLNGSFDSRPAGTGLAQDRSAGAMPAGLRDAPAQVRGEASALDTLAPAAGRVWGRTGYDLNAPYAEIAADESGARQVQIRDLGRLELWLGTVERGYLVANGTLRDLPPGSHLDPQAGQFTWAPGLGYHGTYRLAFVRGREQMLIDVTIRPMPPTAPGEQAVRMFIDVPREGDIVSGAITVAGWALDPQAWTGSGIDAVHVWAQRRDVPAAPPEFLGAATLHGGRPDVARVYGASFGATGFSLTTDALTPGQYDVTIFVWNRRTARWEDARTVALTIR